MSLIDMTQLDRMTLDSPSRPAITDRVDAATDAAVDHDRAAWSARSRRASADIDRVRLLARTHAGDPDWAEVGALLDRLGIALRRDHGLPATPR